jgi:hypothetical protein
MAEVEILAIGGLVFWLIGLAWIVVLWLLVENEHGALGLVSTVAYLAILRFVFGIPLERFTVANWQYVLLAAAGFIGIGLLSAVWLWTMFARKEFEPYAKMRADWLESKGQTQFRKVPDELKDEWGKYLKEREGCYDERLKHCKPPLYKNNVDKIMRWIGFWPISMASWAFNDMIRTFLRMLANFISDWLQGIANRVFASVRDDLPSGFKLQ